MKGDVVAPERVQRKLTTILAADVVGYSRLMEVDEERTLGTLKAYREVIDQLAAKHGGRVFGGAGDSLVAEFGSAVEAVRCALSMQEDLAVRNAELAEERRMIFRIGINVGDVMVDGDNLFGDGVNVAARLEALAEPGGICIAASVFEQVKNKLSLGFEEMGPQEVKNIAEPVSAYRLVPGSVSVSAGAMAAAKPTGGRRWRMPAIATAAVVVVVAGGLATWRLGAPDFEPVSADGMKLSLPDKPSIAVLPFNNMSGDKQHEHLADGLTESIITGLSNLPDVFVIARNSTFTYKGKAVKVRQVAEEFGVRYVLEGSIQVAGDTLRVNAQLIDAVKGTHLWAEQYDRKRGDIFAVQDDITKRVLESMEVKLTTGLTVRVWHGQTKNLKAYLASRHATKLYLRFDKDSNAEARRLFQDALALDEAFAGAWMGIAWTNYQDANNGWSASREASFAKAENAAHQASARAKEYSNPYALLGRVAISRRQYDRAISHCEKAVALARGAHANTLATCAHVFLWSGAEPTRSVELVKRAMRISPIYPDWYLAVSMRANWLSGNLKVAIADGREIVKRRPRWGLGYVLAAVFVEAGDLDPARSELAKLRKQRPNVTATEAAQMPNVGGRFKDEAVRMRIRKALQRAGLPE